ncbi:hypothetical protein [Sinorhizobium sp. BG8]|uniref:hypothetical protein n=1 Tax=Sinorhizobium sp. BG8 TaxID=2613773 RepID=UPI00193D4373|nr:hypothetical protein [Sinorhizobium sp. BG8]QRM56573.1 hypothetical protein F3Y30_20080 [Sinorhizobium sp. BG8]
MADFVAVIRRAVDGLSDNTPEMRVKVYEKARGAVRRQLEAMNPQPPQELVQRQLDKLESAISEVEIEHAEALPAEETVEETVFEAEPVAHEAAPAVEPVAAEQEEEPVREAVHETAEPETAEYHAEPVAEEPDSVEERAEPSFVHEEPAAEVPYQAEVETTVHETVEEYHEAEIAAAPEPVASAAEVYEEPQAHDQWAQEREHVEPPVSDGEELYVEPAAPDYHVATDADLAHVPEHVEPIRQDHEVAAESAEVAPAGEVAYMPSWHIQEQPAEPAFEEFRDAAQTDLTAHPGSDDAVARVSPDDHAPAAGESETLGFTDTEPKMPATHDSWGWEGKAPIAETHSHADPHSHGVSPHGDPAWFWPDDENGEVKGDESKAAEVKGDDSARAPKSAWSDLEDLIGYDRSTDTAQQGTAAEAPLGSTAEAAATAAGAAAAARSGQRSFRAEPRPSRFNLRTIIVILAFLAIVGGAGAGYWLNRDKVHAWIASVMAPKVSEKNAAEKPIENSATENSPSTTANTTNGAAPATTNNEVAALNPGASGGKFTQRLLADGSERDEGPAAALEGAVEEGKSVAEQSEVASAETPGIETPTGQAPVTTDGAAAAATNETAQATETAPVVNNTPAAASTTAEQPAATPGAAQKMFLYEERLGQTAPTAIEGTVAWSSAEETPGDGGKPEPVIRAQINVPSNGLTALMTIRRNADRSLPASHLVEIVFSLPDDFEGGAIESVQRVAMKQTEQDRGDPLIAVPAKITEDFHMIALNDFPEAITKNMELLRTRNWIDIPITYRNGRRALITLDKGPNGIEAFDKVLKAWAALGTTPTDSQ